MKRKIILRNIGIVLIAVSCGLFLINTTGKKQLSDDEIKEKAKELGMVEAGESSLEGILRSTEEEITTEVIEKPSTATESQEDLSVVQEANSTENETTKESTTEEQTVEATTEEMTEEASEEKKDEVVEVTFDVTSGMTSWHVAKLLEEQGIIANAPEFDDFLVNNGYANRIRVGQYKVRSTNSFEEIAIIITSN